MIWFNVLSTMFSLFTTITSTGLSGFIGNLDIIIIDWTLRRVTSSTALCRNRQHVTHFFYYCLLNELLSATGHYGRITPQNEPIKVYVIFIWLHWWKNCLKLTNKTICSSFNVSLILCTYKQRYSVIIFALSWPKCSNTSISISISQPFAINLTCICITASVWRSVVLASASKTNG